MLDLNLSRRAVLKNVGLGAISAGAVATFQETMAQTSGTNWPQKPVRFIVPSLHSNKCFGKMWWHAPTSSPIDQNLSFDFLGRDLVLEIIGRVGVKAAFVIFCRGVHEEANAIAFALGQR